MSNGIQEGPRETSDGVNKEGGSESPKPMGDDAEVRSTTPTSEEGGLPRADIRPVDDMETLVPNVDKDASPDDSGHNSDSSDTVDLASASEKGTYFWVTIGLTYSNQAMTNTGKAIPRWGVGLFFDHSYIAIRFKDPVQNSSGIWYRPEMRFWSREDAVAFAISIASKFRFKLDPKAFGTSIIPDSSIDPISQVLEYVADAGMKVNNLFQTSDGQWRCSMKQENYYDFGEGKSATSAIEAAIHNTSTMSQLSYSAAKKKRR